MLSSLKEFCMHVSLGLRISQEERHWLDWNISLLQDRLEALQIELKQINDEVYDHTLARRVFFVPNIIPISADFTSLSPSKTIYVLIFMYFGFKGKKTL